MYSMNKIRILALTFIGLAIILITGSVQARNNLSASRFAASSPSFAPGAPTLRYPGREARVNTARLSFSWFVVPSANRYRLQVAEDMLFEYLVADVESDATAAAPVTLLPKDYYWRVQARNAAGEWGNFSDTWHFQYALMKSPAPDTDTHTHRPVFSWVAHPNARRYQLRIDDDFDFRTPLATCTYSRQILSSEGCGGELPYGYYYWHVVVDTGTGFPQWSVFWRFTINPKILRPGPIPQAPTGSFPNEILEFTWSSVPYAITYQVQVDDDPHFHSVFVDVPDVTLDGHLQIGLWFVGRYYWRVRAWLPNNITTQWGPTASFDIQTP